LQQAGYAVTAALDDAQALAGIAQEPPDLIVTELTLLRRYGRAWRERLAASATRPALLVSSTADDEPPGVPYLRRPFAMADLVRAVEHVLATRG
jgi:DNA-binding response OmpR family regulator